MLLLLGTQWYILFNVIAGASAIPTDLKEVCGSSTWARGALAQAVPAGDFSLSGDGLRHRVGRRVECQHRGGVLSRFRDRRISTVGLGAVISDATDRGNFRVLLGATVVMAAMVVTINRLFWRRLYTLASTKYRLEVVTLTAEDAEVSEVLLFTLRPPRPLRCK